MPYLDKNSVSLQPKHTIKVMKLNRIKSVLVEKDVSQTDLAKGIGKSFSTINAYCCNRQQPSLELLYKISEYLSVSVTELLVDNKKENEKKIKYYETFKN